MQIMSSVDISLRKAVLTDAPMVFAWRNSETVRNCSLNPEKLNKKSHCEWFANALNSEKTILLIIECAKEPVGVLRYDLDANFVTAEVSIFLKPGLAGNGLGTLALQYGEKWLANENINLQTLTAKILPGNLISKKAFAKAGFAEHYLLYKKTFGR